MPRQKIEQTSTVQHTLEADVPARRILQALSSISETTFIAGTGRRYRSYSRTKRGRRTCTLKPIAPLNDGAAFETAAQGEARVIVDLPEQRSNGGVPLQDDHHEAVALAVLGEHQVRNTHGFSIEDFLRMNEAIHYET